MNTSRITDFSVQESQRLADLSGVCQDLESSKDYCRKVIAKMDHVPTYEEIPVLEALWIAALVRYGRQLATGAREGLPIEVIKSLTPKQQERHEYFMGLRNGLTFDTHTRPGIGPKASWPLLFHTIYSKSL